MKSIISKFDSISSLTYSFSSAEPRPGYDAKYAIKNETGFFYSSLTFASDSLYWMISFSQPVTLGSYSICTQYSENVYVTDWNVSISQTGDFFSYVQSDTMNSSQSKAVNYRFKKPITCKHLKITSVKTSNSKRWLVVRKFDCFKPVLQMTFNNYPKLKRMFNIIHILSITTCLTTR